MNETVVDATGTNSTVRAQLESLARQGHKGSIKKLQEPPFPEQLAYLWEWFESLERGRRYGMNGAEPFTWSDVKYWSELTGASPNPAEVSALMTLDIVSRYPGEQSEDYA